MSKRPRSSGKKGPEHSSLAPTEFRGVSAALGPGRIGALDGRNGWSGKGGPRTKWAGSHGPRPGPNLNVHCHAQEGAGPRNEAGRPRPPGAGPWSLNGLPGFGRAGPVPPYGAGARAPLRAPPGALGGVSAGGGPCPPRTGGPVGPLGPEDRACRPRAGRVRGTGSAYRRRLGAFNGGPASAAELSWGPGPHRGSRPPPAERTTGRPSQQR